MTNNELLISEEATGTALAVLVSDVCGFDFFAWDPVTIACEIRDEFGVEISPRNYNKLMAAVEVITTDNFYRNLPDFVRLCNALSSGLVDPGVFDPADTGEIVVAMAEALLLWPPPDVKGFASEIREYIKQAIGDEGYATIPAVFKDIGVADDGAINAAQAAYADDPAMFASIYQLAQAREQELMTDLREHLQKIRTQLSDLQLKNGKVVRDTLNKALQTNSELSS